MLVMWKGSVVVVSAGHEYVGGTRDSLCLSQLTC